MQYPDGNFADALKNLAKLLKGGAGVRVACIDVGGWDTHVGQGNGTGYLAGRLDELGRGLAGFAQEMGPEWKDTVVVVGDEMDWLWPWRGACRCSWRAFASAFS